VYDNPIQSLGAAEDAEDGLVDRWSRLQEQPAVDGSGGDLDQGSGGGNIAERAGDAEPPYWLRQPAYRVGLPRPERRQPVGMPCFRGRGGSARGISRSPAGRAPLYAANRVPPPAAAPFSARKAKPPRGIARLHGKMSIPRRPMSDISLEMSIPRGGRAFSGSARRSPAGERDFPLQMRPGRRGISILTAKAPSPRGGTRFSAANEARTAGDRHFNCRAAVPPRGIAISRCLCGSALGRSAS
jgi:hypothetical protein